MVTVREYPVLHYDTVPPVVTDPEKLRAMRKWECAIGYRIFAANRWGTNGDGHITARDPILTDHFWVLGFGLSFRTATVDQLVLISPEGEVVEGAPGIGINHAAYNIHQPILAAHPELHSAAHTHTAFGTPWSAHVEPFRALSQESCAFVFKQSMYK